MVSQGKATWYVAGLLTSDKDLTLHERRPNTTLKCYPEVHESEPYWITNGNGTCYSDGLFTTDQFINVTNQPYSGQMQSFDYYYERSGMIADDNYGWPVALEYDEYPLEVQCSSCWINKFVYGYNNTWGDVWE